jgi:hypothetical protein
MMSSWSGNFIEEIRVFPDKLTITVKGGAKEDIII